MGVGPIIEINPIIAHVGPFAPRWYSLAVLAGIATPLWLTSREARCKGLPQRLVEELAIWAIPG